MWKQIELNMFIDKYFGELLEVGDPVFHRNKKGVVIEAVQPLHCYYIGNLSPGYYKVLLENGSELKDYHYAFRFDIQTSREQKINKILE